VGFRQVFGPRQVGDGAADLEDAVVGTGGEPQPGDGVTEEPLDRLRERAVPTEIARGHVGVGVETRPLPEALALADSGQLHPLPDRDARLRRVGSDEVTVIYRRDLEVDVDAVEQRTRDAGPVALDVDVGAAAGVDGVAEVPAGTSPRCPFAMPALKAHVPYPVRTRKFLQQLEITFASDGSIWASSSAR